MNIMTYAGYFPANCVDACSSLDSNNTNSKKRYVLSIDPNTSQSESADDFAMVVLEHDDKSVRVVECYACRGVSLDEHIASFVMLLAKYPISLLVDNPIQGASSCFTEIVKTKLKAIKLPKVVFFEWSGNQIRSANEYMQMCFWKRSLRFLASTEQSQTDLVQELKHQCKVVEVRQSSLGHLAWDVPQEMKKGPNRQRLDLYSALLAGLWFTRPSKSFWQRLLSRLFR